VKLAGKKFLRRKLSIDHLESTDPRLGRVSLVPETCLQLCIVCILIEGLARQAKAEFSMVLRARWRAWLRYWRSLAWWQAPSFGWLFDPDEEIF
jgi:hypothetical protein